MIRSLYLIAGIILFHFLFGWIYGVLLVAALAGYVFLERSVIIPTALGLVLSGIEVAYAYYSAGDAVDRMLSFSANILVDFPDYALIIFSMGLPVIFYYIASWFSYNIFVVYRKLSV